MTRFIPIKHAEQAIKVRDDEIERLKAEGMKTRDLVRIAIEQGLTAKEAARKYDRSLRALQVAADRMGVSFKWEGIGRPPKSGLTVEQRMSVRISSMSRRVSFLLGSIDAALIDAEAGRIEILKIRLQSAIDMIRKERNQTGEDFV